MACYFTLCGDSDNLALQYGEAFPVDDGTGRRWLCWEVSDLGAGFGPICGAVVCADGTQRGLGLGRQGTVMVGLRVDDPGELPAQLAGACVA